MWKLNRFLSRSTEPQNIITFKLKTMGEEAKFGNEILDIIKKMINILGKFKTIFLLFYLYLNL